MYVCTLYDGIVTMQLDKSSRFRDNSAVADATRAAYINKQLQQQQQQLERGAPAGARMAYPHHSRNHPHRRFLSISIFFLPCAPSRPRPGRYTMGPRRGGTSRQWLPGLGLGLGGRGSSSTARRVLSSSCFAECWRVCL